MITTVTEELLEALEAILGSDYRKDLWGYGAAANAMNDDIRRKAIAAVERAREEK